MNARTPNALVGVAARLGICRPRNIETLPATASSVTLERPRQVRRNPATIQAAELWLHQGAIHRAMQVCWVKSDALCQRFSACQGARVAPGDAVQAIVAMRQRPILRRSLPLTERAARLSLQQMLGHVSPRKVKTGWMGGLQHGDGSAGARNFNFTPSDYHFPLVGYELRRAWKVPHRSLTGLRL